MKKLLPLLLLFASGLYGQFTPPPVLATQAEAEAGTNNTKFMSPLRTAQAITAQGGGGAPTTATYITQTANGGLSAEQALSLLGSGLVYNTTTTGVLSIVSSSTVGAVLRVTAANTFAFGAVDLADGDAITGTLPIANGGTASTTASAAVDALGGAAALGSGGIVRGTSPTITTPTISGIYTTNGANVSTANALGAFAIDVTKYLNTKTIATEQTFTFSGTPATAQTWFTLLVTNSDSASHVITIPSSFSISRNGAITTYTIPASGKTLLTWQYDGSVYNLYGDPVATTGSGSYALATSPQFTTSVTTDSTTFALLNTTATTVNAFGAATTVNTGLSATQIWNFGGSTTASEFRFLEPSGSGTNYSSFKSVAMAGNIAYSFPPTAVAGGVWTDVAGNGVLTSVVPGGALTSTYVGYGNGSNVLTGEAAYNYTAATNTLVVGAVSLGAGSEVSQIGPLMDIGGAVPLNNVLAAYGVGTAYQFTNTAAAVDFGTTDPVKVLAQAGTYLIFAQVHLTYTNATVVAETATVKVRRTNNTAADLSAVVVIDLPASTTLTNSYGTVTIPPFSYTTPVGDDSITIFANVSAALGVGTIDATAIGTSIVALRQY